MVYAFYNKISDNTCETTKDIDKGKIKAKKKCCDEE